MAIIRALEKPSFMKPTKEVSSNQFCESYEALNYM
jgi:hypothetical protein